MSRHAVCAALAILFTARSAAAEPKSKEECVDAHARGQDAREAGQLALASRLLLSCAQPACPKVVESECARLADEVQRLQPSVTFAARDGAGNDLPDTSVLVDGTLVTSRLGDGKTYDVDPGRHEVRFVRAGKEVALDVVVNQGEKGRGLVGTFGGPPAGAGAGAVGAINNAPGQASPPAAPEMKRGAAPLVVLGLGAAAAVAGGVITGVGLSRIPARCSVWTHECAAPKGDPMFEQASNGVTLVNLGIVMGGVGLAAFGGSLIWYLAQPLKPAAEAPKAAVARSARAWGISPWVGLDRAGVTFSGAL